MGYVFGTIKKLFFWGYARNTWQYDVLCALILAFIFLTPQSWFDTGAAMRNWSHGEPAPAPEHQKPVASKIILPATDNLPAQMAQSEIENRVRTITGRTEVEILSVRQRVDESGKIVAYEVDIR
jgi:hypothetical protein